MWHVPYGISQPPVRCGLSQSMCNIPYSTSQRSGRFGSSPNMYFIRYGISKPHLWCCFHHNMSNNPYGTSHTPVRYELSPSPQQCFTSCSNRNKHYKQEEQKLCFPSPQTRNTKHTYLKLACYVTCIAYMQAQKFPNTWFIFKKQTNITPDLGVGLTISCDWWGQD